MELPVFPILPHRGRGTVPATAGMVEGAPRAVGSVLQRRPLRQLLRNRHLPRRGRIVSLVLLLAACSGASEEQAREVEPSVTSENRIRCALDGAKAFAPDCTREIATGPDGEVWVIRHPDGGFRRFVLIENGTRIATADGAEEVQAERIGPDLEVRVASTRYLFPAAPDAPKL